MTTPRCSVILNNVTTASEPPLLQLTTQQLDYLVAVSDSDTWAAAAARLGVTPSALSQGLAELERRLGIPLFAREGRRRRVRADAAPVVDYARRVRAQTRDLTMFAASLRSGVAGTVRIGMIDAAAVGHFPGVLLDLRTERPEVDLHLVVAPSGQLIDGLTNGALDLAVIVEPVEARADLAITPLISEDLAIYAPGARRAGPAREWGPFVSFPTDSHTRALIASALVGAGANFDVVGESHQPEVLREMVRLGMGWTVLPVIQAETEPFPLVRARKRPLLTRRLVAARRADVIPDPAVDHLLESLHASSSK